MLIDDVSYMQKRTVHSNDSFIGHLLLRPVVGCKSDKEPAMLNTYCLVALHQVETQRRTVRTKTVLTASKMAKAIILVMVSVNQ